MQASSWTDVSWPVMYMDRTAAEVVRMPKFLAGKHGKDNTDLKDILARTAHRKISATHSHYHKANTGLKDILPRIQPSHCKAPTAHQPQSSQRIVAGQHNKVSLKTPHYHTKKRLQHIDFVRHKVTAKHPKKSLHALNHHTARHRKHVRPTIKKQYSTWRCVSKYLTIALQGACSNLLTMT